MIFVPRTGASWLEVLDAALSATEPAVLITVSRAEGSVPREAGARMLVGSNWQADTIGGGQLEFRAIEQARLLLSDTSVRRKKLRMSLGASLGQCCGGVVHMVLERIESDDAAWVQGVKQAQSQSSTIWRQVALGDDSPVQLLETADQAVTEIRGAADAEYLLDAVLPATMQVVLYGAGHVGKEIARLLGNLPNCRLIWVDPRDDMFPSQIPLNTELEYGDQADVPNMPAQAYWLILSHSHALDFDVLEAILRRQDAAYVGLIGSKTKRASFERRLQARGLDKARMADFTCPIGIPGIKGKEPSVIAVSVVAQLLQLHEAKLEGLRGQ